MKRYMNMALVYAVLAMAGGVFYREFTKINGFTGQTALGVVHTHYFLLGVMLFLLLVLLEKNFSFTGKRTGRILAAYHIGLILLLIDIRHNVADKEEKEYDPVHHRSSRPAR